MHYFIWKKELVSNILWIVVGSNLSQVVPFFATLFTYDRLFHLSQIHIKLPMNHLEKWSNKKLRCSTLVKGTVLTCEETITEMRYVSDRKTCLISLISEKFSSHINMFWQHYLENKKSNFICLYSWTSLCCYCRILKK